MSAEENNKNLLLRNLELTDFSFVNVRQEDAQGVKIGIGACKAVILKLNERDRDTGAIQVATHFYYGSPKSQERECLRGVSSDVVFCKNLEEVFVKLPEIGTFPESVTIQVLQYR